ncbi:hypothetical protein LPJ61_005618 [Coemansia biformis]|uniref:Protein kinase domain-containing protein n=1 Tax=Coemansia biformis TaxID=1286918 RepID=A0A9W8CU60_9FUNG|nr:hypothetical protein LPJ61_005618 [Coemansia biformis]
MAEVSMSECLQDGMIHLASAMLIKWPVYPHSRLAHLYHVSYNGIKVILKLVWTPNNHLPEPAVYDVLIQAGVKHIPEVYDSSTVIEDSFRYQIDYLLIKDAGVSLAEYIRSLNSLGTAGKCNTAAEITQKVLDCLVQVQQAGVLHRNISTGNIAVHNGKLAVINWGYAKLVKDDGRGNSHMGISVDDLAHKWRFDKEKVLKNKDEHDPITGMPLYMSIPILVGARQHSIADDAESALYVLLDAVSKVVATRLEAREDSEEHPIALHFRDSKNLAYICGNCFIESDLYLSAFGIHTYGDEFRVLTDALCEYLFERDGKYISTYLSMVPNFERSTNVEQLKAIVASDLHPPTAAVAI